jgi:hypothetical protein
MRTISYRFGWVMALAIAFVFCPSSTIHAQVTLAQAVAMLGSNRRDDVEAGIQSLGILGSAQASEALTQRIRAGLPADLLDLAINTLTAVGQRNAGPILFELSAHRRPDVRLKAVDAIAALNPPGAESVLIAALSDSDVRVRGRAATALGEIGARSALPVLFHALDRGVNEASGAIGEMIPADQVGRLMGYLNQLPLSAIGPSLVQILERKDISEPVKLDVVARIQEIGTSEAKAYLMDFLARAGKSASANLVKSIRLAIQQIAQ